MNYNEKYQEAVKLFKEKVQAFKPIPWSDPDFSLAMEPEVGIVFFGSYRACSSGMGGCGKMTGWADISWGIAVACCSEECRQAMSDQCDRVLAGTGVDPRTEEIPGVGSYESRREKASTSFKPFSEVVDALMDIPGVREGYEEAVAEHEVATDTADVALDQYKATHRHRFWRDSTHPRTEAGCDHTYPDGDYCARLADDPLHAERESQKEDADHT